MTPGTINTHLYRLALISWRLVYNPPKDLNSIAYCLTSIVIAAPSPYFPEPMGSTSIQKPKRILRVIPIIISAKFIITPVGRREIETRPKSRQIGKIRRRRISIPSPGTHILKIAHSRPIIEPNRQTSLVPKPPVPIVNERIHAPKYGVWAQWTAVWCRN